MRQMLVSSSCKTTETQTAATHSYMDVLTGEEKAWHAVYPVAFGMSPAVSLTGLAYAFHFMDWDSAEPCAVLTPDQIPADLAGSLSAMWSERMASQYRKRTGKIRFMTIPFSHGRCHPLPERKPITSQPAIMFSYGKESVLTYCRLKEREPLLFTFADMRGNLAGPPLPNQYVVRTDFMKFRRGNFWKGEFTPMMFAPLVAHLRVTDLLMGNEWESGLIRKVWGYITPDSFQQSPMYQRFASLLLCAATGQRVNVDTVLATQTELMVLHELMLNHPGALANLVRSCWRTKPDVPWCGGCPKCYRISLLYQALGRPCPFKCVTTPPRDPTESILDPHDPQAARFERMVHEYETTFGYHRSK